MEKRSPDPGGGGAAQGARVRIAQDRGANGTGRYHHLAHRRFRATADQVTAGPVAAGNGGCVRHRHLCETHFRQRKTHLDADGTLTGRRASDLSHST
jgi:hypothetical protein